MIQWETIIEPQGGFRYPRWCVQIRATYDGTPMPGMNRWLGCTWTLHGGRRARRAIRRAEQFHPLRSDRGVRRG